MAKKKKQEKRLNIAVVIGVIFVAVITCLMVWQHRYEFFPQIIKNGVEVHFLTKNGESKPVKYNYEGITDKSKFRYSIEKLIEGPTSLQKIMNTYSEIPVETSIIAIIESPDKNIIDLTPAFDSGGGAESVYNKLSQIINTVEANTDKPTYLFINGKLTEVFGGEGIMITQPLSKESL